MILLTLFALFQIQSSPAFAKDAQGAYHEDQGGFPPHLIGAVAPADEYFGRIKMSFLQLRSELRHREADTTVEKPHCELDDLTRAILDFQKKYPGDDLAPSFIYRVASLYKKENKLGTARALHKLLVYHYPANGWAKRAAESEGLLLPRHPSPEVKAALARARQNVVDETPVNQQQIKSVAETMAGQQPKELKKEAPAD